YAWEVPQFAGPLKRLATFSRLILFDHRGTGLSDHPRDLPTLEARMDDIRKVMDAVDSEQSALVGVLEGGHLTALFAATYPERTSALILFNPSARDLQAPDYPWGLSAEEWRARLRDPGLLLGAHRLPGLPAGIRHGHRRALHPEVINRRISAFFKRNPHLYPPGAP